MKTKIFHIVKEKLFRVHIQFEDTDKYEHYYILHNDKKLLVDFIPTGTDTIIGKNKLYINFYKINKLLPSIIEKHNPDAFIAENLLPISLLNIIKSHGKKIYYINHGIWNKGAGKFFMSKHKNNKGWKMYDGYFVTNYEKQYLQGIGIPENKIHIVNGSPQMDYILNTDYSKTRNIFYKNISSVTGNFETDTKTPLDIKKKCILYLHNPDGSTHFGARRENTVYVSEYIKSVNILLKLAEKHNFHIIVKLKGHGHKQIHSFNKKFKNNKYITFVVHPQKFLMYDFLFSDIILIQSCGTSFFESLLVNPKTVQCQVINHNDFLGVDKYNLLQADDFKQFETIIEDLLTNPDKLITSEYKKNIKQFLLDNIGEIKNNSTTNISNKICELVTFTPLEI